MADRSASDEHWKSSLFRRRPSKDEERPENVREPAERAVDELSVRPTGLKVLMDTAWSFSARSTCSRLHVGCVIAQQNRIVSTGYNGAPAGVEHCDHTCNCGYPGTGGLLFEGKHMSNCNSLNHCTTAVHAEANAIAFAARHGVKLDGCGIYTTHAPCFNCSLLIKSAGIVEVVYDEPFRDMSGPEFLIKNGVACGKLKRHPADDILEA
jgi:dCMP deaminase